MTRWIFMLGGMAIWALHFMGVYGIASVADVAAEASVPASRLAVAGFTVLCALAAAGFGLWGFRRLRATADDPLERFSATLATLSGALAVLAILWQGLPALVGH